MLDALRARITSGFIYKYFVILKAKGETRHLMPQKLETVLKYVEEISRSFNDEKYLITISGAFYLNTFHNRLTLKYQFFLIYQDPLQEILM